MSSLVKIQNTEALIKKQAKNFADLASTHKAVNFNQEAHFAMQAIKANSFLADTAYNNPDSLINAVSNVASVGLSLNPALKHAYLVPRDKKVCLDFGYKGLVHLAIDSGAVVFVQAEIVYQKDNFILKGRGQEPIHERNPFAKDRGEIVGAYCVAKLASGDFLVETMSLEEICAIRDKTQAYKAFKEGKVKSAIWATDFAEMAKKTIIRRASKSWPMSNASRVELATKIQDEGEMAIDVTPIVDSEVQETVELSKIDEIRELVIALNKDEAKLVTHCATKFRRKIESLDELTLVEQEQVLIMLYDLAKKQEVADANA